MAAAIADFLAEATCLYECILHSDTEDISHENADKSTASFIGVFTTLTGRLTRPCYSNVVELGDPDDMEQCLQQACWKISQDITLRLRRVQTDEDRQDDYMDPISYGLAWTAKDVEVLGNRLLELATQWKQIRPEDEINRLLQKLFSLRPLPDDAKPQDDPLSADAETMTLSASSTPASVVTDFILESLSFKSMKNREEEVAEAHRNTFDWIFKYSFGDASGSELGDQFTKWLQTGELGNIYWITGKPGSGKSTIMRYISEHKTTAKMLRSWAGDIQLTKANFYFWTSGSEEQRSQTGLLRYLLHQLLASNDHLMPKVFPDLWKKLSAMSTRERIRFSQEWTVKDLMDGFYRFLGHALKSTKICLFVDGLDEFNGDHQEIIRFFKKIAEDGDRNRVKLCLSSRPWPVFEEAFEYAVPNLKLQELTFNDMATYVRDHLSQNPKIKELINENRSLVSDVVERAEGVFLWVRLVVRKILEIHGDVPDLLQVSEFLLSLPSDLDDLFGKLLFQDQTKIQVAESSKVFQLVHARETVAAFVKDESSNALTIWEISFALDPALLEINDQDQFREATDDEILDQWKRTFERINFSSTGLLEIYLERTRGNLFKSSHSGDSFGTRARRLAKSRITYLHRTVRDYLIAKPGVWKNILNHSPASFDPHQRLIQSHCQRMKHSIEPIEHHRRLDEWYPEIALSLSHARYMSYAGRAKQLDTVNQLERGISWYWQAKADDEYDHWARCCFGTYELRRGNQLIMHHPFLALCTKFGLEEYVLATLDQLAEANGSAKLKKDESSTGRVEEETPLLTYALEFMTSRRKTIMPLSSPSFVESLLKSRHIGHPVLGRFIGTANMEFDSPLTKERNTTPWLLTLTQLRDAKRRGFIEPFDVTTDGTSRWTAIVRMLIEDGEADKKAFLKYNGFDPACHAKDVLCGREQLGSVDDWWIQQLGQLLD